MMNEYLNKWMNNLVNGGINTQKNDEWWWMNILMNDKWIT